MIINEITTILDIEGNNEDYKLSKTNPIKVSNKNRILIDLTTKNIQKVEAMLENNPSYKQFDCEDISDKKIYEEALKELKDIDLKSINPKDEEDRKKIKLKHSSTYYIKAFKYYYYTKQKDNIYNNLIYAILAKINSDNSTRVSIESIYNISKKIYENKTPDEIINLLKEPYDKKDDYSDCSYELIKIISGEESNRHNFSLATKFCHYMNFYIFNEDKENDSIDNISLYKENLEYFENLKYRDIFSIYDSVIRDNLIYYYKAFAKDENGSDKPLIDKKKYIYEISKLKKDKTKSVEEHLIDIYKYYQTAIDDIIKNKNISRNGFDHLVWYTNKGEK